MITVVSGLPRSGTSMLMQMLAAGGMPALTDHQRATDEDNLRGYYEFEQVKRLERDASWVPEARGKAVKVISALLRHLPPGEDYRVLFIHRQIDEVLASQRQMLIRRGEPTDTISDERLAEHFRTHLAAVERLLEQRSDMRVLNLEHAAIIARPDETAHAINRFLDVQLDVEQMAAAVDRQLYRQRVRRADGAA